MMSPLQILHEQLSPNALVITLIGQMDESNVDANAPRIYELIAALPQGSALIMNFSGLEYMNSKSIGYTMDFFNKMNEKGGAYIIAEPQPQIADILTVVGLAQVVPIIPSLQEAKNMVLGETSNTPIPESVQQEEIPVIQEQMVQPEEEVAVPEIVEITETQEPVSTEEITVPKQTIEFIQKETLEPAQEPVSTPIVADEAVKNLPKIEIADEIMNFRQQKDEKLQETSPVTLEKSTETTETQSELPSFLENQSVSIFPESKPEITQETTQPEKEEIKPTAETPAVLETPKAIPQNSAKEEEGIPILAIAVGLAILIIVAVLVFK